MLPLLLSEAAITSLRERALPNPYAKEENSKQCPYLIFSISLLQIFLKTHQISSFISSMFIFHYFNVNLVPMAVRT